MPIMFRRFALAAAVSGAMLGVAGLAPAQDGAEATPAATPASVRISDLPPVLDHDGTLDDAVADEKGVRRSVMMGGLDKITARTFRFEAPVGHTVKFRKLMITPRTCHVRPPEETPETAVFIEIAELPLDGGESLHRLFSGWMFASSPGLNALEHPVYDVWVIGCQVDDPANPLAASSGPQIEGEEVAKPTIDDDIEEDEGARE